MEHEKDHKEVSCWHQLSEHRWRWKRNEKGRSPVYQPQGRWHSVLKAVICRKPQEPLPQRPPQLFFKVRTPTVCTVEEAERVLPWTQHACSPEDTSSLNSEGTKVHHHRPPAGQEQVSCPHSPFPAQGQPCLPTPRPQSHSCSCDARILDPDSTAIRWVSVLRSHAPKPWLLGGSQLLRHHSHCLSLCICALVTGSRTDPCVTASLTTMSFFLGASQYLRPYYCYSSESIQSLESRFTPALQVPKDQTPTAPSPWRCPVLGTKREPLSQNSSHQRTK